MATILPLVTEMLIGGVWTNVTADRRIAAGLSIGRGRGDWSQRVDASTCEQVFENADGKYGNRNPMSPYYGLLGHNTQLRHRIQWAQSSFSSVTSNSWPNTNVGNLAWTNTGGAAGDFSCNGAVGLQTLTSVNVMRASMITPAETPLDVTCRMLVSQVATGASMTSWLVIGADASNFYTARPVWLTDGTVRVDLLKWVGGVETNPAGISGVVVGAYGIGLSFYVRLQWRQGGFLRCKAWPSFQAEPAEWTITTRVSDADIPLASITKAGLFSRREPGNTNVNPVAQFDDFEINDYRFWGETSKSAPAWDKSGRNVTVPFHAAGILKRLGRGPEKPLKSPLYRAITAITALVAFWPMTDGAEATSVGSAITGGQDLIPLGALEFSRVDGPPGDPFTFPETNTGAAGVARSAVTAAVTADTTGSWTFEFNARGVSNGTASAAWIPLTWTTANMTWKVMLTDQPDGDILVQGDQLNVAGGTVLIGPSGQATIDSQWHQYRVTLSQVGGNMTVTLYRDGVQLATATTGGTAGRIMSISPWESTNVIASSSIGDVALYSGTAVPSTAAALNGYAGETAAARLARLCAEEGVYFDLVGDPADTQLMGPQQVGKLVELWFACQDADQGILYEPRDAFGIAYRTRRSLYTQPPVALDYAGGHIGGTFQPIDDDQLTVNDVTVKRIGGSSARFTVTEGPLSTQDPPNGAGVVEGGPPELNLAGDDQNFPLAAWIAHLGTWDEARYPALTVLMTAPDVVADNLTGPLSALDVGGTLTVANVPSWQQSATVGLMVQGTTEFVGSGKDRSITFLTVPSGPYQIAVVDGGARVDSETAKLNAAATSGAATITVADTAGAWITTATFPADFPFDIEVGGERMTVTAIVGAASPQTFTVTRSVNGVVKAHAINTPVSLWDSYFVGL